MDLLDFISHPSLLAGAHGGGGGGSANIPGDPDHPLAADVATQQEGHPQAASGSTEDDGSPRQDDELMGGSNSSSEDTDQAHQAHPSASTGSAEPPATRMPVPAGLTAQHLALCVIENIGFRTAPQSGRATRSAGPAPATLVPFKFWCEGNFVRCQSSRKAKCDWRARVPSSRGRASSRNWTLAELDVRTAEHSPQCTAHKGAVVPSDPVQHEGIRKSPRTRQKRSREGYQEYRLEDAIGEQEQDEDNEEVEENDKAERADVSDDVGDADDTGEEQLQGWLAAINTTATAAETSVAQVSHRLHKRRRRETEDARQDAHSSQQDASEDNAQDDWTSADGHLPEEDIEASRPEREGQERSPLATVSIGTQAGVPQSSSSTVAAAQPVDQPAQPPITTTPHQPSSPTPGNGGSSNQGYGGLIEELKQGAWCQCLVNIRPFFVELFKFLQSGPQPEAADFTDDVAELLERSLRKEDDTLQMWLDGAQLSAEAKKALGEQAYWNAPCVDFVEIVDELVDLSEVPVLIKWPLSARKLRRSLSLRRRSRTSVHTGPGANEGDAADAPADEEDARLVPHGTQFWAILPEPTVPFPAGMNLLPNRAYAKQGPVWTRALSYDKAGSSIYLEAARRVLVRGEDWGGERSSWLVELRKDPEGRKAVQGRRIWECVRWIPS